VLAVACLVAACSDDGGGDDEDAGPGAVCPVRPEAVAEELDVAVDVSSGATPARCTYVVAAEPPANDEDGPGRVGGRVVVDVRAIGEGDFSAALQTVERRSGPTEPLAAGDVSGANRGWVGTVGRAVTVGAADDQRLVTVVVVDPSLDAAAAREAALHIAGDALS